MEGLFLSPESHLKGFCICCWLFLTLGISLTFEYICEFSYKLEMAPKVYSGGPEKMIREKNVIKNLVPDSL
jgi:hypothetical protein